MHPNKYFQKMKSAFTPIGLLCSVLSAVPVMSAAQSSNPSPQQGIEQSTQILRERTQPKALAQVDLLGLQSAASIDQLMSVQVQGALLKKDIEQYWKSWLGQPVSAEQLQEFHSWFYEKARQEGFMAYVQTQTVNQGQGQNLIIQTLQPKVNNVRILSSDPLLLKAYADLLQRRFEVDFKSGSPLDTLGLDQRLDSVSYDLPLELDATLRAVGPELLDLIVNITPAAIKPGQLLGFVQQWTHYGLKQYGRVQVSAFANWAGLQEKSSLSVIGQISEGVGYARAEYEGLLTDLGRWRLYTAKSHSKSILTGLSTTRNNTSEAGAGFSSVLGGHRATVFKGHAEVSTRKSDSHLVATGAPVSLIIDHQLRLRWTADNERLSTHPSRVEMGLIVGDYKQVQGPALSDGSYTRVDVSAKTKKALDSRGSLTLIASAKGQWANRNLDSYNQMALGGVSGVRAFTSVDGVGDRAFMGSLEFNKKFKNQWSAGVFYDAGYVETNVTPLGSPKFKNDTLQAVGLKLNGQMPGVDYSFIWAKGVGGYKSWQDTNLESRPNNHRLWAGVTLFF
jgi:hemolysin activation/secretion protein